jgi:hypothetical protein
MPSHPLRRDGVAMAADDGRRNLPADQTGLGFAEETQAVAAAPGPRPQQPLPATADVSTTDITIYCWSINLTGPPCGHTAAGRSTASVCGQSHDDDLPTIDVCERATVHMSRQVLGRLRIGAEPSAHLDVPCPDPRFRLAPRGPHRGEGARIEL